MRVIVVAALCGLSTFGYPQAFNIDIDLPSPPELGGGAPSNTFGAAASQQGVWNAVYYADRGPRLLYDTGGQLTRAAISVGSSSGELDGGAFRFGGNTGDFAQLLNDACSGSTVVQGGVLTYSFAGMAQGVYDLYTYAVPITGTTTFAPVFVAQADDQQTQVVTGPMPGNQFGYLKTHSRHRLTLAAGSGFDVVLARQPGQVGPVQVNGFQIVPVPEVPSLLSLSLFCSMIVCWRRLRRA